MHAFLICLTHRTYDMPIIFLSMPQILTHLILLTTLSDRHYHFPQCTDEETEFKKTCPRSQNLKWPNLLLNPGRIVDLNHH